MIQEEEDDRHLSDLFIVLLEENWVLESVGDGTWSFRKNGTDYDYICVRRSPALGPTPSGFCVTVPLPTKPCAYRVRITTAMDVYLYVTAFIEYYAETTLSLQYRHKLQPVYDMRQVKN